MTFEEARTLVASCDGGTDEFSSWIDYCRTREVFFLPTTEFACEVVRLVRALGAQRVVEICAGAGRLARALAQAGLSLTATDPQGGEGVETLDVAAALRKHRPDLVIAAWVPSDIRADRMVLEDDCVRWYLWINAEINGLLFSPDFQEIPGVRVRQLPELARWTVSRLDYLSDFTCGHLVQHARVVLFERKTEESRTT